MTAGAVAPGAGVPLWEDGAWSRLPALEGPAEADSCVVGLGGTGLTLVHALLARGESVVGLDAADVGAGAAGRNGGFLLAGAYDFHHDAVTRYGRDHARMLYEATLEELPLLAAAAPGTVRFTGSRRVAADDREVIDCEAQWRAMQRDGLPVEWDDGPHGPGLFFPRDGAFNPLARCRILARSALAGGARLYARTPAVEVGARHVRTLDGTLRCRRVFVAVDGGLEQLFPELVGRVRTARLQMLATAPAPEVHIPTPMYYRDGFEYWQQLPTGEVALGGFRDRGGEGEWGVDPTPTPAIQGMLEALLRDRLGVRAPVTHRWGALASFTPTGLPLVTRVRDGVWVLGGYCGTGNVIGALCAKAVVAAALDRRWTALRRVLGEAWRPSAT
ncbi:MAG: FAD-binding oxidoreductase [Gemmatimonadetes bacterium]|nr:FAD-binding oxidoreductase [Gemmatimonadota bacterium]